MNRITLALLLLLSLPSPAQPASTSLPATAPSAVPPAIAAALARLPARSAGEFQTIMAPVIEAAPQSLSALASLVVEPGPGGDWRVRDAVHGLTMYYGGQDPAKRRVFLDVIIAQLAQSRPVQVKAFLIHELQLLGDRRALPALGSVLLEADFCEPAAQAIVSLGGDEAAALLRKALPSAQGPQRLTLIQALGVLRDAAAAELLVKATGDADAAVRLAAVEALGRILPGDSPDAVARAAEAMPYSYAKIKAMAALLDQARELARSGKPEPAREICRDLLGHSEPEARGWRCAALRELVAIDGSAVLADLASAIEGKDTQLAAVAMDVAGGMKGSEAQAFWTEKLATSNGATKAAVASVLGRCGDRAAIPALLRATGDSDAEVRAAALSSAARLGGSEVAPKLVEALGDADSEVQRTAQAELATLGGPPVTALLAGAASDGPVSRRTAALMLLARRGAAEHADLALAAARNQDKTIRAAGLEALAALASEAHIPALIELLSAARDRETCDSLERTLTRVVRSAKDRGDAEGLVLQAMAKASRQVRLSLIAVVGGARGPKALDALRQATSESDPEVVVAALRAMAAWPDDRPLEDLRKLSRSAKDDRAKLLAASGYIRLIGISGMEPSRKLALYKEAASGAPVAQKRLVLAGLSAIELPEALTLLTNMLDDKDMLPETTAALLRLGERLRPQHPDAVRAAMDRLLAVLPADSKAPRDRARRLLGQPVAP
jgi:HEAT repeat protein